MKFQNMDEKNEIRIRTRIRGGYWIWFGKMCSVILMLSIILSLSGCGNSSDQGTTTGEVSTDAPAILHSPEDISLSTEDGVHFSFRYGTETFRAEFHTDTWKIVDSYRIRNTEDMLMICRALTEIHPIPTAAGDGFRTPEDLVFEWEQHNIAYELLPENARWKDSARDVDLNPADQGKGLVEFIIER